MPPSKLNDPEWLRPGPSRRCQGHDLCTATAPTASVGLLCIGGPRAKAVGECRMCARFFCGACATRTPERIEGGASRLWAWRLGCPRCGLPLGDPLTSQAAIHFSRSGLRGGCEDHDGTRRLVAADRTAIEDLGRQYLLRGLGELATLYTAASREGKIAAADRALNEAPGEPLAWLFKAALSAGGNYAHAAQNAFRGVARCGAGDALMIALLGQDLSAERLGRTAALRKSLDQYAADLAVRKSRFNPALIAFDASVQIFVRGESSLGQYVAKLFAHQTQPPVVRDYLNALQMENAMDNARTEADRRALMGVLLDQLSDDEMKTLLARSLAMKVGSVSMTDYYAEFRELIVAHGVDLAPWPHMASYLRYVSEAAAIDFAELHRQIWEMEQAGYAACCETELEKSLVLDTARAHVAYRLLDHLEGKSPQGQLAATVAHSPKAFQQMVEKVKQPAEPRPVGLFGRIKRWLKK